MNPITQEIVEQTWEELHNLDDHQVSRIVEQMSREQPAVLAYLMATGRDMFNMNEREWLLYLGIAIWRIMSRGDQPLPKISDEQLDAAEEANFKMLEKLSEESTGDFIAVTENMLESYNQIEVLRYVVEALMEAEEEMESDGAELDEDNVGMMLIFIKTVIDCFDAG